MAARGISPDHEPVPTVRTAAHGITWPAVPDAAGAALLALLGQLEQSERWPPARLHAAQNRQLAATLAHARATVPAYRETLAGLDLTPAALDRGAFTAVPLLTRARVQDLGDALHSTAVPASHGPRLSFPTSGSTGRPLTAWGTGLTQLFAGAINLRDHRWHRRDVTARFGAIRTKVEPGTQPDWGGAPGAAWHTGPAVTFPITRPLEEQLDWLLAQRPGYLISHPSNLAGLLALSARRGVRPDGLREVLSFGEAVPPGLRERCARDWHAAFTDRYTCEEAAYLALECPDVPGHYHVQAEHVRVEVLDDAGAPCPPGVPGRVAITTLHNHAMPLVRYLIGDWASAGPACACGRGLPVLTAIHGRVRNLLRLPDGRRVWPSFPAEDWLAIAPVRQFQLRQTAPRRIAVQLALAHGVLDDGQRAALTAMLRARLSHDFDIHFEVVAGIAPGPGGKFEDFVCELPDAPD